MSCPSGFEEGLSNTCRVVCPPDYKYIQDSGVERCVSAANNNYFVKLQAIPKGSSATAFTEEQSRFLTEFIKLTKKIKKDQDALRKATNNDVVAHHETIRSTNGLAGAYTEAIETLKPLRPPTQPHEDIMLAKLSIRELSEQDVRALQICLFFVIIALFEYLLLPASFVHGVAFFTLCVGFSLAIYLRNR
jgi:hypothetical protein